MVHNLLASDALVDARFQILLEKFGEVVFYSIVEMLVKSNYNIIIYSPLSPSSNHLVTNLWCPEHQGRNHRHHFSSNLFFFFLNLNGQVKKSELMTSAPSVVSHIKLSVCKYIQYISI